jgi:hypothetical protein
VGSAVIRLVVALGVLSRLPGVSLAQDPPDAHALSATDLIKRAVELRRNGDHASALTLLQRAYTLQPADARTNVQLGLVEFALGRWADAEDNLVAGLRQTDDPWIIANKPIVLQSLQTVRRHVGSLEITGEPTGAEVLVNGRRAGLLPLDQVVRVNAGVAYVEVRAAGYRPIAQTVRVMAASVQPVVAHLQKEVTAPVVPSGGGIAPAGSSTLGVTNVRDMQHPAARALTVAKFAVAASAVVAAGVATYGFLRHEQLVDDFRQRRDSSNRPRCLEAGTRVVDSDGLPAMADCVSLRSSYTAAQKTMIAGLVAAGILSGAAVTLWILDSGERPARTPMASTTWRCAPTEFPTGLSCAMRF